MININVDFREKSLMEVLQKNNTSFNISNLELGDITFTDSSGNHLLIIERKTVKDLAASIRDGRYVEQSMRLNSLPLHNHNIIYLIEEDIDSYKPPPIKNAVTKEALYSSIFSILYFKGFSILKTKNLNETAEFITRIYQKISKDKRPGFYTENNVQQNNDYATTIKSAKKDNITLENIDSIMLSQIPNVSTNIANAILVKFNSLGHLIESLKSNPETLKGISYEVSSGKSRRISKTAIENIIKYLKVT
tara:strand:- start:4256 stop:5002 length:747 start_codon:yes stop_codon:yes gene_type:complete